MYNAIFDLPEHFKDAIDIGRRWRIETDSFTDIKNIVIVGMGGSAIGGDLIRSYLLSELQIPFHVCRHYELPEFVDDESLVIASSYSGNTEETLAAVNDALTRKSMLAAVSTGGMLHDLAKLNEIPIAILPSGLQPRAAIAYSFVPVLMFLEKIGLLKDMTKVLTELVTKLEFFRENYIEDMPIKENLAKQLARRLQGRIPIIYSGPTLTDAVAVRWKGQICENSKILAFANQFAEFNHNELVGWSEPIIPHLDSLAVLILRDVDDHPQIRQRMNFVKEMLEEMEAEVIEIHSKGDHKLHRMFNLIQLGDFVSYYLAVLYEVDPTPVDIITALKNRLSNNKS